jgi:hypothetical protein
MHSHHVFSSFRHITTGRFSLSIRICALQARSLFRVTSNIRHPPRDFWQKPDLCPSCKNYRPREDICTTCKNPRYYYGNELLGEDTLPLLARLMSSAIVKEDDNNMAQFYVESLIDYYVIEYYELGRPANPNATEDPNNNEPSTI